MDLDELRRTWDRFGATDPLWAVLTSPDKKHGRWDIGEFFEAGRAEIDLVLGAAAEATGRQELRGRALDFGCGVGRLSQALAERFDRVDGVDIAPSMIERANALNSHGGSCVYHLNTSAGLDAFADETFDFIYTAHVLQHMEPRFARGYVREFVRVLRPGGVLVFQIPVGPRAGATGPLPDEAFRAELRFLDAPARTAPGTVHTVRVVIRNASPLPFPAAGTDGWFQVTAGNHWARREPSWSQVDDARARLPHDLAPGEEVTLELEVTAPGEAGSYVLTADLCQEGVDWFSHRGSAPVDTAVEVTRRRFAGRSWSRAWAGGHAPARAAGATGDSYDEPRMEMYGTPEHEVTEWVKSAGGSVLAALDWDVMVDQRPPPDWVRRCFLAAKGGR